jgi:hypothetical protein
MRANDDVSLDYNENIIDFKDEENKEQASIARVIENNGL